jgi:hypothetical protein
VIEENDQIGPDHELSAMGEIEKIHDPEDERQAGSYEEQEYAKLQAVESLNCQKRIAHGTPAVIS